MSFRCAICEESTSKLIDKQLTAIAYTCGHWFCGECALRCYLKIDPDNAPVCPIPACNRPVTKVLIVDRDQGDVSPQQEFVQRIMNDFDHNQTSWGQYNDVVVYKKRSVYDRIIELTTWQCSYCDFPRKAQQNAINYTVDQLQFYQKHLQTKHKEQLCKLCFLNLRLLPLEYHLFDDEALMRHNRYPSRIAVGLEVDHHLCNECNTWHFDKTALDLHITEKHLELHYNPIIATGHSGKRNFRNDA